MENKLIKVYVAGAYSDNNVLGVLKNIGRGEYWASELFMKGFAPFTPWHDKTFVIQNWDKDFTVNQFYDYSMEWLRVSDVVFIIPNANGLRDWELSSGTLKEIEEANVLNIPVCYNLYELLKFRETLR